MTIRDKINQISDSFQRSEQLTFHELLGDEFSRMDVVILFLALLELIKGNFIEVMQDGIFDDIRMIRRKEISEMREFSLKNLEL